ncbi:alpha/beta fold hydrolase [Novosphingobium sp. TH158]|uniref:alpha/beta fold hydrolase n=1 Tax=Novosphingobium sp. TH158 TaxID=2067455 RepID=UPI000C7BCF26|nr:alpha/beta hydrolase [Novosphingobium sp. TH158]PLK26324.1 alpha/beta hydrolase [Novosphingobium sp. TH158]
MTDFVFLHGGGQGGWVWDETIAALQAQAGEGTHRLLALDAPGCGAKRGRDTSAITFEEITAELVGDIEAAGLGDVVLVGHSQAGAHMPAMAELRLALFRQLIFVTCTAPDPGLTVVQMTGERVHKERHPFHDSTLPVRERYRAMFCNDMAPLEADAFLDRLGEDQWPPVCYSHSDWRYDHLAELPVSYVLCLEDAILPLAWQEYFARAVHARSTPRIDAGHQVMNTRPHALAEVLLCEALGEAA